jgi:LacI family transcriptional regulator
MTQPRKVRKPLKSFREPRGPNEIYLVLPPSHYPNREILRGIYSFALPKMHWIFFFINQSVDDIRRARVNRNTAGIIGRLGAPELAKAAASHKVPAINIHGGNPMGGLPLVGPDFFEVGRFAARRLLDSGVPHLGFYGLKNDDACARSLDGFEQEVALAGAKSHPLLLLPGEKFPPRRKKAPQMAWLENLPKPVAIYSTQDVFAAEIAFLCCQIGLRIPEDVVILGTNNDEIHCLSVQPALSSIRLPWQEIGWRAASMLDEIIMGKTIGREPVRLGPPDFVPRQSTEIIRCRDEVVGKALGVIHEHLIEPLTIDDLAMRCGVSRRNLEKRFRAVLDRSPLQEQNRLRVELVKTHLREDGRTIEQVADICGFSSPIYLSQFFHRETGMSPGTYRKSFHESREGR